jgi:hypothetical protein
MTKKTQRLSMMEALPGFGLPAALKLWMAGLEADLLWWRSEYRSNIEAQADTCPYRS